MKKHNETTEQIWRLETALSDNRFKHFLLEIINLHLAGGSE